MWGGIRAASGCRVKGGFVDDAGVEDGDAALAVDEQGERHLAEVEEGANGIGAYGYGVVHVVHSEAADKLIHRRTSFSQSVNK